MIVKAETRDVFLGFVEPLGVGIDQGEQKEIDDKYADHESFLALKAEGVISIVSYGAGVSQLEFNQVALGLYKATVTAGGASVQGAFTQAELTSVNTESYDLRTYNVFDFKIDSIWTINVPVPAPQTMQIQDTKTMRADHIFWGVRILPVPSKPFEDVKFYLYNEEFPYILIP